MVFCGRYSAAFGKRGVEPIERSQLVANLHKNTVEAAVRLMEHCGYTGLADISSEDFYQCSAMYGIRSLKELYFNQSQRHNADVFWSPVLN